MTRSRMDGIQTRQRLLDAAGAIFAEHGFRNARTADICRAAGANIAAVNYYFRSKEQLYAAAWRHEFDRSLAAYPPDGGVPAGAPAEERLRGHIAALVRRSMDPASRDLDIAHREMSNPTGLLAEVMHRSIEPLRLMHFALVRELLGPAVAEPDVQLCAMSIHGQCVVALMHERRRLAQGPRAAGPPRLKVSADALAEHVFRFSLGGLSAIRSASGQSRPAARGRKSAGR